MTLKKNGITAAMLSGALLAALPSAAGAQTVERTYGAPNSPIASLAFVPAGANIMFVSGTTPSPVDPAKPEELGDTKAQTLSILTKMKASLEAKGFSMGDIVKMTVFLVGTPETGGRMDSAGMNEVFRTFFGTAEQPNKPTRSTIQVAALGRPTMYVEIEAIAAKMP
ncbi:enamine deaminase RidA (YjgF/YER057c/UK114 family) [Sphingobium sp. B11D3B]|uniref:Rid family hydrolase n=1 Tax=Sphingobium sp. B11D3B TaxID=2940575 RepID=UPI00222630A3|nr:Rid family hydrolase [Sphingobium sp. B11D3B]MCW2389023.1 enamine deaminase RidA (YjgF/YER057c/UK114 family) [Sphingobium sp. B11D3B]